MVECQYRHKQHREKTIWRKPGGEIWTFENKIISYNCIFPIEYNCNNDLFLSNMIHISRGYVHLY